MPVDPGDLDTNTQYLRSIDHKTPSQVAGSDTPVSGQKVVTTAGTAVAVGGDVAVKGLIVIADPDNGGNIYAGPATVDSATGCKLPPGGVLPLGNVNLSEIFLDADYDGEGISYYYTV